MYLGRFEYLLILQRTPDVCVSIGDTLLLYNPSALPELLQIRRGTVGRMCGIDGAGLYRPDAVAVSHYHQTNSS